MGFFSLFGRAAKGVGKLALDQTSLTEKGRDKIARKETDELRKLRLKEARRKEYDRNRDED